MDWRWLGSGTEDYLQEKRKCKEFVCRREEISSSFQKFFDKWDSGLLLSALQKIMKRGKKRSSQRVSRRMAVRKEAHEEILGHASSLLGWRSFPQEMIFDDPGRSLPLKRFLVD
jgi:hypothetical protein